MGITAVSYEQTHCFLEYLDSCCAREEDTELINVLITAYLAGADISYLATCNLKEKVLVKGMDIPELVQFALVRLENGLVPTSFLEELDALIAEAHKKDSNVIFFFPAL